MGDVSMEQKKIAKEMTERMIGTRPDALLEGEGIHILQQV